MRCNINRLTFAVHLFLKTYVTKCATQFFGWEISCDHATASLEVEQGPAWKGATRGWTRGRAAKRFIWISPTARHPGGRAKDISLGFFWIVPAAQAENKTKREINWAAIVVESDSFEYLFPRSRPSARSNIFSLIDSLHYCSDPELLFEPHTACHLTFPIFSRLWAQMSSIPFSIGGHQYAGRDGHYYPKHQLSLDHRPLTLQLLPGSNLWPTNRHPADQLHPVSCCMHAQPQTKGNAASYQTCFQKKILAAARKVTYFYHTPTSFSHNSLIRLRFFVGEAVKAFSMQTPSRLNCKTAPQWMFLNIKIVKQSD